MCNFFASPVITRSLYFVGLLFLAPLFVVAQGTVTFGSVTYNSGNGLYGVDVFYNNPIANLAGLNIDIQFENIDSDDIQISSNETDGSTSSDVSATVITGGYIGVEFNDDGSAPISLGANDLVGTIYFSILSGETVDIEFRNIMIYDIGFNKTYDEDDFTLTNTSFTASTIEISGQVINFASSAGLENAKVIAINNTVDITNQEDTTPISGNYTIAPFNGTSYDIGIVVKGDTLGGNGCVNSIDLDTLMEHILGRNVFTEPFEYIAGDVSEDGSITTYDAVQLNKELVGNKSNEFNRNWTGMSLDEYSGYSTPASGVPTINGKISLNNVTSSSTLNDFYAIKGGDVDKSCAGAIATLSFPEKQENLRLAKLSQQSLVKGESARIPIYGPDYTSTNVISLSFEPIADVKVLGIESGSIEVKDYNFNISDKVIDFL